MTWVPHSRTIFWQKAWPYQWMKARQPSFRRFTMTPTWSPESRSIPKPTIELAARAGDGGSDETGSSIRSIVHLQLPTDILDAIRGSRTLARPHVNGPLYIEPGFVRVSQSHPIGLIFQVTAVPTDPSEQ